MRLESKHHSFIYNEMYDGPLQQYLDMGYKIVREVEVHPIGAEPDVSRCAELKFDDQHSDGVVPNSNETDEDIKDRRRTDET